MDAQAKRWMDRCIRMVDENRRHRQRIIELQQFAARVWRHPGTPAELHEAAAKLIEVPSMCCGCDETVPLKVDVEFVE